MSHMSHMYRCYSSFFVYCCQPDVRLTKQSDVNPGSCCLRHPPWATNVCLAEQLHKEERPMLLSVATTRCAIHVRLTKQPHVDPGRRAACCCLWSSAWAPPMPT